MVNQKPISVKMEYDILEALDAECSVGWMMRNRHINEAVRFYLDYKDTRRRIRTFGSIDDKMDEYQRFLKKWFPDMACM
mgnify:CR=1 FL=1